jgi:hypothetical protein
MALKERLLKCGRSLSQFTILEHQEAASMQWMHSSASRKRRARISVHLSHMSKQGCKTLRPFSLSAMRPPSITVSTSSTTTVTLYTLETLDEELIIMALLCALLESYNSLHSSLFIQSSLNLQIVEAAFLAEDNQCNVNMPHVRVCLPSMPFLIKSQPPPISIPCHLIQKPHLLLAPHHPPHPQSLNEVARAAYNATSARILVTLKGSAISRNMLNSHTSIGPPTMPKSPMSPLNPLPKLKMKAMMSLRVMQVPSPYLPRPALISMQIQGQLG